METYIILNQTKNNSCKVSFVNEFKTGNRYIYTTKFKRAFLYSGFNWYERQLQSINDTRAYIVVRFKPGSVDWSLNTQ